MSSEKQNDKLIENLEELNKKIELQNSLPRTLVIGIIHGVGFIVGTSILAALFIGTFVKFAGNMPIIEDLIEFIRSYQR
jgi:hypothetical protein